MDMFEKVTLLLIMPMRLSMCKTKLDRPICH